jgi:hypothetical protein
MLLYPRRHSFQTRCLHEHILGFFSEENLSIVETSSYFMAIANYSNSQISPPLTGYESIHKSHFTYRDV